MGCSVFLDIPGLFVPAANPPPHFPSTPVQYSELLFGSVWALPPFLRSERLSLNLYEIDVVVKIPAGSSHLAWSQGQALGQGGPAPGAGIVGPCIRAGCQAEPDSQEAVQLGEASGIVSREDGSGTVIDLSQLFWGTRLPVLSGNWWFHTQAACVFQALSA